jgi:hypothetical protein
MNSFWLIGLVLLLALEINNEYSIAMLAHPLSIAITSVIGTLSYHYNVNTYFLIPISILVLIIFLLTKKNISDSKISCQEIKFPMDILLVFAISLLVPVTYLIMNPYYAFGSEDIQRDLYDALILSKRNIIVKPLVIPLYKFAYIPIVRDLTPLLPYAIYIAIIMTSIQAVTLYAILRHVAPSKIAIPTFILYLTGVSNAPLLNIISGRDYYIPSPTSPTLPLSMMDFLTKYKYYYTSFFSLLSIIVILTNRNSITRRDIVVLSLLNVVVAYHSLTAINLIIVIILYITLLLVRVLKQQRIEEKQNGQIIKRMALCFILMLETMSILYIGNRISPNSFAGILFSAIRMYLVKQILTNPVYLLEVAFPTLTIFSISIIMKEFQNDSGYVVLSNAIKVFLLVLTIVSTVFAFSDETYKEFYEAAGIHYRWNIGPPGSILLASYSIFMLMLLIVLFWPKRSGRIKIHQGLNDFVFLIVLSGILETIAMVLLSYTEFITRICYGIILPLILHNEIGYNT